MFPLNIVCKCFSPLAHIAHSISLRTCARKKSSQAHNAAAYFAHTAKASMKCGFLAHRYLIDDVVRARVERA